jgi:hypothetical protein
MNHICKRGNAAGQAPTCEPALYQIRPKQRIAIDGLKQINQHITDAFEWRKMIRYEQKSPFGCCHPHLFVFSACRVYNSWDYRQLRGMGL